MKHVQPVSQDLRQRVVAKVDACIDTIQKHYKVVFRKPTIKYDVRGTTAGYANYVAWTVRFNPVLLAENVDDFIENTVPHEVAHLACDLIYPEAHRPGANAAFAIFGGRRRRKRDVHGPRWQSIMRVLGADPSRCHTYDVTNARVKKRTSYAYVCSVCSATLSLGPKRHAKMQAGKAKYWHTGCGSASRPLVLATAVKTQPAAPVAVKKPDAAVGSKLHSAMAIYRAHKNTLDRQTMIETFVNLLGMTKAGASTYYYNCRKALG